MYLRRNEHHLRGYFETLLTLLQSFFLLQGALFCETDLVIKICKFMTATRNDKSLRQYKIRFYLIVEETLTFASSPKMVTEVKRFLHMEVQLDHKCFKDL